MTGIDLSPAENRNQYNLLTTHRLRGRKRKFFCFSACLAVFISVVTLTNGQVGSGKSDGPSQTGYVGDEKCLSCHRDYKTFSETAHHLTSREASRSSIAGDFSDGRNILKTEERELIYRMEAKQDGFFQTAVLGTAPDTVSMSQRFDLVIGSGRKGQTYLYWDKGERLYQLPVSYWTELASWVNSPGYGARFLDFSRPVLPRCLECHASFFEAIPDQNVGNHYKRSGYVLGVSCERCHGPGAEHAALNATPGIKPDKQAIVNPAKLPRERQLDMCALCHGGIGVAKAPTFSFAVGKSLSDYLQLQIPKADDPLDVHGNQIALLERSRCFKSSGMTCSTCHNVHSTQRKVADFSQRCLGCHKVQSCGLYNKRGNAIADKCIDCHLPNQISNVIFSLHDGTTIKPRVRNHWIRVY